MVFSLVPLALLLFALVGSVAFFASLAHKRWGLAASILLGGALPFSVVLVLVTYSQARLDVADAGNDLRGAVGEIAGDVGEAIGEGFEGFEGIGDSIGGMGDAIGQMGDRVGNLGDRIGNGVDRWVDGKRPATPPTPPKPPQMTDAIEEMDAAGVSVPQIDLGDDAPEIDPGDEEPGDLFETLETAAVSAEQGDRPAWVDDPPKSDEHTVRSVVRSIPSPSRESAHAYAADSRNDWLWTQVNAKVTANGRLDAFARLATLSEDAVADRHVEQRETSVGTVYIVHELLEYDRRDEAEFLAEVERVTNSRERLTRSRLVAGLGAGLLGFLGAAYTVLRVGSTKA